MGKKAALYVGSFLSTQKHPDFAGASSRHVPIRHSLGLGPVGRFGGGARLVRQEDASSGQLIFQHLLGFPLSWTTKSLLPHANPSETQDFPLPVFTWYCSTRLAKIGKRSFMAGYQRRKPGSGLTVLSSSLYGPLHGLRPRAAKCIQSAQKLCFLWFCWRTSFSERSMQHISCS